MVEDGIVWRLLGDGRRGLVMGMQSGDRSEMRGLIVLWRFRIVLLLKFTMDDVSSGTGSNKLLKG